MHGIKAAAAGLFAALAAQAAAAQGFVGDAPRPPAGQIALGREMLAALIGTDSTHAKGSTHLAQVIADRLLAEGFPAADVQVLAPSDHPTKGSVVLRLAGTDPKLKPVLYLGHLDTVDAPAADWASDPFTLSERDGFFYGRGAIDMKSQDASLLANVIRLHREGRRLKRGLILALTADEEAGSDASGIGFLIDHHRDLIDAGLVINPDVGEGVMVGGARRFITMQAAEKMFLSFDLDAADKGGHSSRPTPENPIYRLARALAKVEATPFPVDLTDTVKANFAARAAFAAGQTAADLTAAAGLNPPPEALARLSRSIDDDIIMRTTCVATMIQGGHAESALPQRAHALLQCRMVPGETTEQVQARLEQVIHDPQVKITVRRAAQPSPPSAIPADLKATIQSVAQSMWPGVAVMPAMSASATDSSQTRRLGIPSFGVDGTFVELGDYRAHGIDERVSVRSFEENLEFIWRLMNRLGS